MDIILPNKIEVDEQEANRAVIAISPCYPGYGTTLGNALRRVLLSSLEGGAVTSMKIKGVDHEFSTLANMKEDVVEIILNMKSLRFRMHTDEPVEMELVASGDGTVTGKNFTKNSSVEVMNPEQVIATLTDKTAEFSMKAIVQKGRGYVPVEDRDSEELDVGYIAIDSVYTPVRNVNYRTEHVRVGQMTNYDKLLLDIVTDGTVTPEEAFRSAAQILVEQFQVLASADEPMVELEADPVETTETLESDQAEATE